MIMDVHRKYFTGRATRKIFMKEKCFRRIIKFCLINIKFNCVSIPIRIEKSYHFNIHTNFFIPENRTLYVQVWPGHTNGCLVIELNWQRNFIYICYVNLLICNILYDLWNHLERGNKDICYYFWKVQLTL